MDDTIAPTWLAAVFPVFFVSIWLFVLHLLAWMGGWRELAASYGATGPIDGRTFLFRTGRFGTVNYGSCLTFTVNETGLRIAVSLPFRPGHRPFVVPWPDISATEHRGWVFTYVDLQFRERPQARLRVTRGLANALFAAGGNAVRIARAA